MNKYLYYVLNEKDFTFHGPFSFREAVAIRDSLKDLAVIAKLVIDYQGKEVK